MEAPSPANTTALSYASLVGPTRPLELNCSKAEAPTRISLACMTCRSRKVRCNGESPCSSCISSNRECVFVQAKSKRRRKTNAIHPSFNKHIRPLAHPAPAQSTSIASFHAHSITLDMNSTPSFHPPALPLSHEPMPVRSHHEAPLNNSAKTSPNSQSGLLLNNSPGYAQDEDAFNQLLFLSTRAPYFRSLGPTAIAPGAPFREISVYVKFVGEPGRNGPSWCSRAQSIHSDHSPLAATPMSISQQLGGPSHASRRELSTEVSMNLTEDEFRRNVDVFCDHMGSYLACIKREDLLQSSSQGKASEALKYAISAVAECIQPSSRTIDYAEIRSSRAKTLCMPHLSLPSLDTTFALLLLAYCEFGRERDSGLWMWCGLAMRMATDMGLHKSPGADGCSLDDPEYGFRQRLFWSCYHLDRLISSGTGRVATLLDSEIEFELPPLETIKTDLQGLEAQEELLAPMHHLTQILILLGQVSDTFNRTKADATLEPPAEAFRHFRTKLHIFHAGLPSVLHFNASNARRYMAVKHGEAFLLLHLWFHSLVIITHNPASVGPGWNSLDVGPIEPLMLEWSRRSLRSLCDMIAFLSISHPDIFQGVPFASQPIMIAGLASIPHPSEARGQPGGLSQQAQWHDFDVCLTELIKMQTRWRGVTWLVLTLQSRARNEHDVDLSKSGGAEVGILDISLMKKLLENIHQAVYDPNHNSRSSQMQQCSCDRSLVNKIAENIQQAVHKPTSNGQPSHLQHFVGLSASGTFYERASGQSPLVHRPEVNSQAQSVPSSARAEAEVPRKDQQWQGPHPQSRTIPVAGPSSTPSRAESLVNHHVADEAKIHRPNFRTSPSEQKVYPFNPDTGTGTGPVVHLGRAKVDPGSVQPYIGPSPSWVAQPIPQMLWPTVESLEEFSMPADLGQFDPRETGEGLIGNSGPSSGVRVDRPQMLCPTIESVEVFSKPAALQPGETGQGLIQNSGPPGGSRMDTLQLLWPMIESADHAPLQLSETGNELVYNSGPSGGLTVDTINLMNGAQAQSGISTAVGSELWFQLFHGEEGLWSSLPNA